MDTDSPNTAEHVVTKKSEGMLRVQRMLLALAYLAFSGAYFAVCYALAFIPLVAILPMLLWILIYFTWRYVSYDNAYTFSSGTMTFSRIYARTGKRIRREKLRIRVQDSRYAGLWDGSRREDELKGVKRIFDFASTVGSTEAVFVVFTDEKGQECAVRFDCINRVKKLLKSFCPRSDFGNKEFRY